jgi:hypothetical protein
MLCAATAHAQVLSSKRGFADVGANYNNLQATGAGWYYTWGTGAGNPGNFDAKHYPMFWSAPSQSTINNTLDDEPAYILGFNEPERPDQANMSVAAAISAWTNISNTTNAYNAANNTSIKLVSPAVADTGGAGGGQQWLASFMSQAAANNLKVDAVAFHWYGVSNPNNPSGAASSFLGRVDSYYNSYQKPVFITEFAIHDWGGAYTDEEIAEANRQFLSIVIPGLESRSHVAGYAWYHWFSDAHLYEGNPMTPTDVGFEYVGTIKSGTTYNFNGVDLGQHVAYLGGGELTNSTGAGTLRYINALSNSSRISGTANWTLNGWVRVQPGATLKKIASNTITWNGTVDNNGVIEVTQGTLRLANNAAVNGSGVIRVNSGSTLDLTGARDSTSFTIGHHVNLRGGAMSTVLPNGIFALSGSTISGSGTVAGKLTALAGSVIQVGDDGVSVPRQFVIENFESYALGNVRDVASPPWTAHGGGTGTQFADIESFSGNKVLTYGWSNTAPDSSRGTSRDMPAAGIIENNDIATFFFRVNSKTDDPDHSFGLSDSVTTTANANFDEYETQVRLVQGASAGTFAIQARNGGAFTSNLATGLALNSWYNVWMVVNQATDMYDVYMNTGSAGATAVNKLNASPLAFRNGTPESLSKILALASPAPVDNGVRIDDLVYSQGVNLTNPLNGLDSELTLESATFTVQGNLTLNPGTTLKLDIFDPSSADLLDVDGAFTAGGTLSVTLVPGAPAPQPGDAFDILDFTSASGVFSAINLPTLLAGLAWNTNSLLSDGVLRVGLAGDFNNDGNVDTADYVLLSKTGGTEAQFNAWRTNFGRTMGSGSESQSVPEPTSAVFIVLGAVGIAPLVRKRRF